MNKATKLYLSADQVEKSFLVKERHMDDSLHELKSVLQILALPVTGQVHLVKDDCTRVEVLAGVFNTVNHRFRAEGDRSLTPGQKSALEQLNEHLAQVNRQSPLSVCSELSMRRSAEWRQIGTMARETLVRFDWPLEIPAFTLPSRN